MDGGPIRGVMPDRMAGRDEGAHLPASFQLRGPLGIIKKGKLAWGSGIWVLVLHWSLTSYVAPFPLGTAVSSAVREGLKWGALGSLSNSKSVSESLLGYCPGITSLRKEKRKQQRSFSQRLITLSRSS